MNAIGWQFGYQNKPDRYPWVNRPATTVGGFDRGLYRTMAYLRVRAGKPWDGRAWVSGILVYDSERKDL